MSNWNVPLNGVIENAGFDNSNSQGATLSFARTEFFAATAYEWQGFLFTMSGRSNGTDTELYIGLGSGSDIFDIVEQLRVGSNGTTYASCHQFFFPLRVPKGSRVTARLNNATSGIYGHMIGLSGGWPGAAAMGAYLERIGAVSGVESDSGGSANTKGSWVSIGTTVQNWRGMYVICGDDGGSATDNLGDIAIDVSGNKQIIIGDMYFAKGSGNTVRPSCYGPIPCSIPAGTELFARHQCNSTSSFSRPLRWNVHGIVG